MTRPCGSPVDVFSVQEIARAAGVPVRVVTNELGWTGRTAGYIPPTEAAELVRRLRGALETRRHDLFEAPTTARFRPGAFAVSGAAHVALAVVFTLLTTLGLSGARPHLEVPLDRSRLVFLATPGPGGGGGGGGLQQPLPPPKAEMKGTASLHSPVPPPKPLSTRRPEPERARIVPPPLEPTPRPAEPPPPAARPALTPQVAAPVATVAADPRDRAGVLGEASSESESQGTGSGSGVGTGQGTGIGEGTGAGIGPGTGGGTGGGPYRPGSGITPPDLLHEVRPEYTDDARRRGIEGDVVLEIVVRRDGSVGDVKVVQALAAGLERRAVEAVRQWRFSPARRFGTPVDVIVEVAVEFKLR